MIPESSALSEARALAERKLAQSSDAESELARLKRLADSFERDEEKLVVYLRAADVLSGSSAAELAGTYGDEVVEALEILTMQEGDSFADVVMRAGQSPMTYDILANEIGEELSRLAQVRGTPAFDSAGESRWELLILSQALLDRVGRGDDARGGDPEPVVIESAARTATVYLHPVHGDVVVLVRGADEAEGDEDWVLINNQDLKPLLLELVADLLDKPLREGLVPWLEQRGVSHRVYTKEGGEGVGGTAVE